MYIILLDQGNTGLALSLQLIMPYFSLKVVQPPRVARGTPLLLLKARYLQLESAADCATNVKAIKP